MCDQATGHVCTYGMAPADRAVRAARRRAHRDNVRAGWVLVLAGSALVLAGALGVGPGDAGCTPDVDGCRFVSDGQTWQTVGAVTWPVCTSEDAPGPCVWDASRDGNGRGVSFTVADGVVTALD